MTNLSASASLILGLTHGLEPGHGKTFLAAYMLGEKLRWKEVLSLGFSMLVSHFLLLILLAVIFKFAFGSVENQAFMEKVEWVGPIIIIVFGSALFIRYWRKRQRGDHGPDCNCPAHRNQPASGPMAPTQPPQGGLNFSPAPAAGFNPAQLSVAAPAAATAVEAPSGRKAAMVGFLTGFIPCPTVLTPILISSTSGFAQTLELLLLYVAGMSIVLTGFIGLLVIARDFMARQLDKVEEKVDIRLVSAGLIVLVGFIYLAMALWGHSHGGGGEHIHVH